MPEDEIFNVGELERVHSSSVPGLSAAIREDGREDGTFAPSSSASSAEASAVFSRLLQKCI